MLSFQGSQDSLKEHAWTHYEPYMTKNYDLWTLAMNYDLWTLTINYDLWTLAMNYDLWTLTMNSLL